MADDAAIREGPTRALVQRRLEEIVRGNRFTIAVVFPLVGAVTLVASAEGALPEGLAFNPLLLLFGTAVMRSPLVVGLLPRVDSGALAWLGLLSAYTYAIEIVGVHTGWPYGSFEYGVSLGPTVGGVPVALPLFFVPLAANAYLLAVLALGGRAGNPLARLGTALAGVLAIDLVLDPAAVAVGFWAYAPPGGYYGVPASNYAGWVLSGAVAVGCLDRAFDRAALLERVRSCEFVLDDLASFVLLWGAIDARYGNVLAVGVAAALGLALVATGRYGFARPRRIAPGG